MSGGTAMIDPLQSISRHDAQLREVHDGDTYSFLVNWKRSHNWTGAVVVRVRLRDYSCPELAQPASDMTGLVSGQMAKAHAQHALDSATRIQVELQGKDSMGRDVCWVWIDGASLGQYLVDQKASRRGAFEG